MKPLTKKQKQVLDFVKDYISEYGISPTIEEVRRELKLKAVSTIHEHLNTLREKGYLSKNENSARSIAPKKDEKIVIEIPVIGKIAAGFPIEGESTAPGEMEDKGGVAARTVVTYTDTGFAPLSVTIKKGTTVTFVNESSRGMWVASAVHPTHQLLPGFDQESGWGVTGYRDEEKDDKSDVNWNPDLCTIGEVVATHFGFL